MATTVPRYRAKQNIFVDGVLGYAPGDDVPADNVELHGWIEAVEEVKEVEETPKTARVDKV